MSQKDWMEKDYYKKELQYQQVIDGSREASQLATAVAVSQNEGGIHVQLPGEMKNRKLTGEIWFYCAYDEKKDQHFILEANSEAQQSFALSKIQPGNYTVKIRWNDESKNYYAEQPVTIL